MQERTWFSEWFNSPYYHLLYSHRDDTEAKEFIARLIQHLNPLPGSLMLDVGCGRGRHSRQLAALGFKVTGIDVAPENISFAQQFASTDLTFQVHDMRNTFCAHCMNYVFNFFTSFGYFDTAHEHDRALHTMATALKKGGVLVIDFVNAAWAIQHLVEKEEKTIRQIHFEISRWHTEKHLYKKIVVTDEKKQMQVSYTEKVALFSKQELTQMIEQQDLKIIKVAGDYQLQEFNNTTSPRLIFIAERLH